jgi:hypothetical protein
MATLFQQLPDDLIEMVWKFDGRYTKLRNDMKKCFDIIDYRRIMKRYSLNEDTIELMEEQKSLYQQQDISITNRYNSPYTYEIRLRALKYDRRCSRINGALKGVIGPHKTNYEFTDVIGHYSIRKTKQFELKIDIVSNSEDFENVVVKSKDRFWEVVPYTNVGFLFYLHNKEYDYSRRFTFVNGKPDYISANDILTCKNEKNGIELLDPKFIKKAQKTKRGKALIQHLLKV